MKRLKCIQECLDSEGKKIMDFTKGKVYLADKSYDPPGWEVRDDKGNDQSFYDLKVMFKEV